MNKSITGYNYDCDNASECALAVKNIIEKHGISFEYENTEEQLNWLSNILDFVKDSTGLKTNTTVKVPLPECNVFKDINTSISYKELAERHNIVFKDISAILNVYHRGKIPILQGKAGIGKTYIADNISDLIFKIESEMYPEIQFTGVYKYKISCTAFAKIEFSKGIDAVGNYCKGVFAQLWDLALQDESKIIYVVLDEFYQLLNVREAFGEFFADLTLKSKPKNLVLIATGNDDSVENLTSIVSSIYEDSGISRRFKTVDITPAFKDEFSDTFSNLIVAMRNNPQYSNDLINLYLRVNALYSEFTLSVDSFQNVCCSYNIRGRDLYDLIELELLPNISEIIKDLYISSSNIDVSKAEKLLRSILDELEED